MLMDLRDDLRQRSEGVDAGPYIGWITDMEFGDDEILLAGSTKEAKLQGEDYTHKKSG